MTALLLDEMLSGAIAAELRGRDVAATAVVEDPELVGLPDEDLLARAATMERTLVTANIADFAAIAADWRASGREHAGLVYVANRAFPQDRSFVGALVTSLAALIADGRVPTVGGEVFLRRR